jgi:hypothetical protein
MLVRAFFVRPPEAEVDGTGARGPAERPASG